MLTIKNAIDHDLHSRLYGAYNHFLTPQTEVILTPDPESANAASSAFNGILAVIAMIAAGLLLFFLLRWFLRLIRKSRSVSLEKGFRSEKIAASALGERPTLRQRLHSWLHPEVLSPVRKQYKEANG